MSFAKRKRCDDLDGASSRKIRKHIEDAPRYGSSVVRTIVRTGNSRCRFSIHTNLLTRHSGLFEAALNGEWRKSKHDLPLVKPQIFELFEKFLYNRQIFSARTGDRTFDLRNPNYTSDKEWRRLAEAWVLGEELESTTFKDAVTDALNTKMIDSDVYPLQLHNIIYPRSTANSCMRRLLVQVAIQNWDDDTLATTNSEPAAWQFYRDVAVAQRERRGYRKTLIKRDPCTYHEHVDEGTPCYKTMLLTF